MTPLVKEMRVKWLILEREKTREDTLGKHKLSEEDIKHWLNLFQKKEISYPINIKLINLSNFINQKKINHIFIFVAGFSGVYTCCLLPLFATNFFYRKNFFVIIISHC